MRASSRKLRFGCFAARKSSRPCAVADAHMWSVNTRQRSSAVASKNRCGGTLVGEVTVVIGNYQGADVLGDCLDSLHGQSEPPAEVLVVDGESTDASEEIAKRHGAHWLPQRNRGLGFLYNRG